MTGCNNPRCDSWLGKYHIHNCEHATEGNTYLDYRAAIGPEMEERNDEWGAGCSIDGASCFGCGECCD